MSTSETLDTIVIGGGQAGLAAGYFLAKQGASFAILDQNTRTGDVWRQRWDSLRLFTPAKMNGLPGKPFPGADFYFPTKDEAADYLEAYADTFHLPVRHNVKVNGLARSGGDSHRGFRISTSAGELRAERAIVATGAYQKPYTPSFARELDPAILQVHSSAYCNPLQMPVQNVLVVGAGNSGAEIGLELTRAGKRVWLAGKDVGKIPADKLGRLFGGRLWSWVNSRLFRLSNPIGRNMGEKVTHHGSPLIRTSREDLETSGVEFAPRVTGAQAGKPLLEDGRSLPAEGVVWATGFRPDYSWVDLPIFNEYGFPRHRRGVVEEAPGLFFMGLPFQTALSSALLGGVGEDAEYVVRKMMGR